MLVLAAGSGIYWILNRPQDRLWVVIPPVNSRGMISALMELDSGVERLVTIAPDGAVRRTGGGGETEDKEFVWHQPKGERVIFISNRASDGSFQLFDWLPDRDNDPYQLTPNGADRRNPWFSPGGERLLIVSQGQVFGVAYPKGDFHRVFPPSNDPNPLAGAEGEVTHSHDGEQEHDIIARLWNELASALEGDAFEQGFLDRSGRYFVGIYATARGSALVVQYLPADPSAVVGPAAPWAGERVDVAMHPTEPVAVVAIRNFRYPIRAAIPEDMIRPDGTIERPFVNAVIVLHLDKFFSGEGVRAAVPIFLTFEAEEAVVSPAISPDGSEVALVQMESVDGEWNPDRSRLLVAPLKEGGIVEAREVASGRVREPCWSPDGQTLAFVRDGDIWTVNRDGTGEKNLTQGKGSFRSPRFSPRG